MIAQVSQDARNRWRMGPIILRSTFSTPFTFRTPFKYLLYLLPSTLYRWQFNSDWMSGNDDLLQAVYCSAICAMLLQTVLQPVV